MLVGMHQISMMMYCWLLLKLRKHWKIKPKHFKIWFYNNYDLLLWGFAPRNVLNNPLLGTFVSYETISNYLVTILLTFPLSRITVEQHIMRNIMRKDFEINGKPHYGLLQYLKCYFCAHTGLLQYLFLLMNSDKSFLTAINLCVHAS